MTNCSRIISVAAGMALVVFAGVLAAQNSALTRTIVTKADVSVPGREAVVARVEIAPGGIAGWHTHPGDEVSYVMAAGHQTRADSSAASGGWARSAVRVPGYELRTRYFRLCAWC